jgi:hypothetical protein
MQERNDERQGGRINLMHKTRADQPIEGLFGVCVWIIQGFDDLIMMLAASVSNVTSVPCFGE